MKKCTYCGYANYDNAVICRKCDASFWRWGDFGGEDGGHQGRSLWIGPVRAEIIRSRALPMVVLGLLITVYWGGYGPWPTVDSPILVTLRKYLEPVLLFGGAMLYLFGWIATLI